MGLNRSNWLKSHFSCKLRKADVKGVGFLPFFYHFTQPFYFVVGEKMRKTKVGDFVKIKYFDHSEIENMIIEKFCNWKGVLLTDIGRVEAINKDYIILSQTIINTVEGETEYKGCGILRNNIVEIVIFKPSIGLKKEVEK